MGELVEWLNDPGNVHPVLSSGIAQFQLVHIHPLSLYRAGYDIKRLFSISEFYDRDRMAFYQAIQGVRQADMDLTGWLEFFTQGLATQLDEVKDRGERAIRRDVIVQAHNLTERQAAALQYVMDQGRITIADFERLCPEVNRRSLQRDLKGLIGADLLTECGETNRKEYVAGRKLVTDL